MATAPPPNDGRRNAENGAIQGVAALLALAGGLVAVTLTSRRRVVSHHLRVAPLIVWSATRFGGVMRGPLTLSVILVSRCGT